MSYVFLQAVRFPCRFIPPKFTIWSGSVYTALISFMKLSVADKWFIFRFTHGVLNKCSTITSVFKLKALEFMALAYFDANI